MHMFPFSSLAFCSSSHARERGSVEWSEEDRGLANSVMAESNGGGLERRVAALEAARIELEDAMLVHATLESRAAQRIKEHAHFIARHEEIMGEIDDKLNGVIGTLDDFRRALTEFGKRRDG